ncbi:4Fe-4S binding protein [Saccharicrinis aurantiacus]|uniref:4Fe-4S binding protein n=1 Tax=Saccharicrinis aurantiacus TaxID=1849719 RepID=UPI002491A23F|nr:4Fe-4S binding protein [Saccharicrinis aurantiacus]
MKINNNVIKKASAYCIIILLVGVWAIQNEQLFGIKLFTSEEGESQKTEFELTDIQSIFSSADKYEVNAVSILVYSGTQLVGWAINSSPFSDSITGYTSSVPLLIGFDNSNKLQGISLLKNYESPDFIGDIVASGFLKSWDNIHINKLSNKKVDAFSGATLSSTAIIKTLRHRVGQISEQSASEVEKIDLLTIAKTASGYLLIILALLQFFFTKKMRKVRTLHQVLTILILGFWLGTFLSIFSISNWIIYGIDLPAKLFVFVILILSIGLPLFTSKSFYCSHLCPFGASQDLLGKIKKDKVKLSPRVKEFLSTLQEKVFATIMLLLFTGVGFDLTNIEPFSAFIFKSASIPVLILALTFLALSVFTPRPWCRFACPTGYILNTIRKPIEK